MTRRVHHAPRRASTFTTPQWRLLEVARPKLREILPARAGLLLPPALMLLPLGMLAAYVLAGMP